MSLTMQPNDSTRWIKRTISLLSSPKRGVGKGERSPASRVVPIEGGGTARSAGSVSSSLIARSRRFVRSSSTNGMSFGMRALAFSGEKNFMPLQRSLCRP